MTDAAQSGASADAVKDEGTAAGNGVIVPEQVPVATAAAPAMPPRLPFGARTIECYARFMYVHRIARSEHERLFAERKDEIRRRF